MMMVVMILLRFGWSLPVYFTVVIIVDLARQRGKFWHICRRNINENGFLHVPKETLTIQMAFHDVNSVNFGVVLITLTNRKESVNEM